MAYVVYPRDSRPFSFLHPVLQGSRLHPTVAEFLQLDKEQIVSRYCATHKDISPDAVREVLSYQPEHFRWAGADLFPCVTAAGRREMVVLEVNSCPCGQKYMPHGGTGMDSGYHKLMGETFRDVIGGKCDAALRDAPIALVHDDSVFENGGYKLALADLTQEPVFVVESRIDQPPEKQTMRWTDGVMEVKDEEGQWHAIRAAFRYVTQKPWTRIPLTTKTVLLNPISCCLAGARNKLMAARAYEEFNKHQERSGLCIRTPRTFIGVTKEQLPAVVKTVGGKAVIKNPFSNSGHGIYTVTSQKELDEVLAQDLGYERFIVQSLIGHENWSTSQWHHAGTVPDKDGNRYVFDMRLMVHATPSGFRPTCSFSRRADRPLPDQVDDVTAPSWNYLGTNLSLDDSLTAWEADADRQSDVDKLLTVDWEDFDKQGLGLDELVDGFVQTVMATTAIDKMCRSLTRPDGSFDLEKFDKLADDKKILSEIQECLKNEG
ncbi:uncharacterized protein LOC118417735 [Branchiostoma floridae]|uniref:Uncharacterized protein LOC118417735 n=1 Tax=Branchiostoma floridae TaxID=7739 RepID=C3YFQ8_BRAFL|nr:uncharacterized protein LOC118417735 [Branchiostoma floridae]|eukprot:XP_002605011.1 hypothetical protein BRAFLDRAFT_101744 [Branchiostoma floridae]